MLVRYQLFRFIAGSFFVVETLMGFAASVVSLVGCYCSAGCVLAQLHSIFIVGVAHASCSVPIVG